MNAPLTCLARSRGRPMRFFGGAMRGSSRRRMSPLCRAPAFQALLKGIHQADNIARPLFGRRHLDRLAGGLAPDQRLQRSLVFVLEFRRVEMRSFAVEDVAGEFDHGLCYLWVVCCVAIFMFFADFVGL